MRRCPRRIDNYSMPRLAIWNRLNSEGCATSMPPWICLGRWPRRQPGRVPRPQAKRLAKRRRPWQYRQAGVMDSPFTILPEQSAKEKTAAMEQLREEALACTKCEPLVASRKQVVVGVGTVEADLMFIGEAPGRDEDREGEPFVGAAGQLLTKII